MKQLNEIIREATFAKDVEIERVEADGDCKYVWMSYDDNSGMVIIFQADKPADLAEAYSTDEEYYKPLFHLKVGQTYTDEADVIYTRIQ